MPEDFKTEAAAGAEPSIAIQAAIEEAIGQGIVEKFKQILEVWGDEIFPFGVIAFEGGISSQGYIDIAHFYLDNMDSTHLSPKLAIKNVISKVLHISFNEQLEVRAINMVTVGLSLDERSKTRHGVGRSGIPVTAQVLKTAGVAMGLVPASVDCFKEYIIDKLFKQIAYFKDESIPILAHVLSFALLKISRQRGLNVRNYYQDLMGFIVQLRELGNPQLLFQLEDKIKAIFLNSSHELYKLGFMCNKPNNSIRGFIHTQLCKFLGHSVPIFDAQHKVQTHKDVMMRHPIFHPLVLKHDQQNVDDKMLEGAKKIAEALKGKQLPKLRLDF